MSPLGQRIWSGAYPSRVDTGGFQGWHEVRKVAETASTNADLVIAADAGEAEGLVLVAERQTAGRGRLDRSWDAPPGEIHRACFRAAEMFHQKTGATGEADVDLRHGEARIIRCKHDVA